MIAHAGGAANTAAPRQQDTGSSTQADAPAPGVFDELSAVLRAAHNAFTGILDLLSLEARRAGLALMWITMSAVIAAVCIVASWLGLMVAVAMWAVALGLPPIGAVIIIALLNCLGGVLLIKACIVMSRDLLFPATRRQVAGAFPIKPSAS